MNLRFLSLVLLGMAFGGTAAAQPSGGFHLFKDKTSGKVVCAQYAISPDWIQQPGGPFQDQGCKVPEPPRSERKDQPAVPPGLTPKK